MRRRTFTVADSEGIYRAHGRHHSSGWFSMDGCVEEADLMCPRAFNVSVSDDDLPTLATDSSAASMNTAAKLMSAKLAGQRMRFLIRAPFFGGGGALLFSGGSLWMADINKVLVFMGALGGMFGFILCCLGFSA